MTYYSLIKEQARRCRTKVETNGSRERETSKPDFENQEGWSSTNAEHI